MSSRNFEGAGRQKLAGGSFGQGQAGKLSGFGKEAVAGNYITS
jgi:hypothetical protein